VLVGEADAGPDYTLEDDLDEDTAFGPDEESAVVAKYRSGQIVDAFKKAVTPSKDPDITGAPSLIKIVKTNPSTKASLALPKIGGGTYTTLKDASYGKLGNLFTAKTDATAEVVPSAGEIDYLAPAANVTLKIRVDGGAETHRHRAEHDHAQRARDAARGHRRPDGRERRRGLLADAGARRRQRGGRLRQVHRDLPVGGRGRHLQGPRHWNSRPASSRSRARPS
jgi:hypothetical protein